MSPNLRTPIFGVAAVAILIFASLFLMQRLRAQAPVTLATWTEPSIPDTVAGRQFDAYLDVLNAGDQEALKQFVREHFSPNGPGGADINARIQSQLRFANTSRGLNLYEVTESSDTAVTVTAQLRLTQEWRQITFMVEGEPPYLVSGIMVMPSEAPIIVQSATQREEPIQQQIDDYVRDLVAADRFSGVVLVAADGVPLFQGAYGAANKEQGIPNEMSTRFSVASVGKMFTAVAIAQLVEAGKLSYTDTIDQYLPQYPAAVAQGVTIDHLLTHRSGIADFFADEAKFAPFKDSLDPQRDYLPLFIDEPLHFTPGERFEYSNSNYILLGAIIEAVSGQRYADYLRTYIFAPAGMTETSLASTDIDTSRLAHGYTELAANGELTPGERRAAADHETAIASAAGGAYTTAGDLLKFDQALRSYQLLTPAATRQLFTPRVNDERPGYQYGYGFTVRQTGDEQIVGHSGGFPGVDAQFDMYMESGYTVIVLANYELVAETVVLYIGQRLPR